MIIIIAYTRTILRVWPTATTILFHLLQRCKFKQAEKYHPNYYYIKAKIATFQYKKMYFRKKVFYVCSSQVISWLLLIIHPFSALEETREWQVV